MKPSHRASTRQVPSDGAATAGEASSTGHITDPPDCFSIGESADPSALQLEQIVLTAYLSCVSVTINIRPFKETSEQDKKNKTNQTDEANKNKAANDLPVCLSLSRLWV